MAVNPNITILLDLYGEILTEKERDALDYYYNDDLSLKEIADNEAAARRMRRDMGYGEPGERETISRQGVRDTIKRAERKLIDIDEKLGLTQRFEEHNEQLGRITQKLAQIEEFNLKHGCHRDITDLINSINSIIEKMYD